jgi:hypothetical protein
MIFLTPTFISPLDWNDNKVLIKIFIKIIYFIIMTYLEEAVTFLSLCWLLTHCQINLFTSIYHWNYKLNK